MSVKIRNSPKNSYIHSVKEHSPVHDHSSKMVNVKDLDDIWQLVKREAVILTGNATGEKFAAAVKSLGEKIQLQLIKENKRLHYVIFNMEQPYKKSFEGFMDYQE